VVLRVAGSLAFKSADSGDAAGQHMLWLKTLCRPPPPAWLTTSPTSELRSRHGSQRYLAHSPRHTLQGRLERLRLEEGIWPCSKKHSLTRYIISTILDPPSDGNVPRWRLDDATAAIYLQCQGRRPSKDRQTRRAEDVPSSRNSRSMGREMIGSMARKHDTLNVLNFGDSSYFDEIKRSIRFAFYFYTVATFNAKSLSLPPNPMPNATITPLKPAVPPSCWPGQTPSCTSSASQLPQQGQHCSCCT
jgi:hypothetical protein